MMEQQQQQGELLPVHTSQLTKDNVGWLAQQGYGILPDQSGWLVFVRVPQQSADVSRQSSDGAADGAPGADAASLTPNAERLTPSA